MPSVEEGVWVEFRDEGNERSRVHGMRNLKGATLVLWHEHIFRSHSR